MTALVYQDFDLSIEPSSSDPARYRVRVSSLGAGQASGEFVLPFSAQDLEILLLRLGRPRRGVRAIGSPEMQAAQAFGSQLFATVFTGPVQSALIRSLSLARQQGQGLRIRLRLSDAPALADLPWEFLYDPTHRYFLAYSTATPLVRFLDLPHTVAPLAVQPPLKVLVMIANPRDHSYFALNVEDEWRKVQGALADLQTRGLVQVTRLEAATLSALQRQLRRDHYHIFHFVGHGGFDNESQSGVLLLEDEEGRSRRVSGQHLGALLRDHFSLRLALLNACEGARTGRFDPFAGVAQHLVQQGIPAVIAMQFEITDQAAITLSHEFYNALADNYGVDAALSEARKALFTAGNDIEWGTPVLFMRALNGEIFDFTSSPAAKPLSGVKQQLPEQQKNSKSSIEFQTQGVNWHVFEPIYRKCIPVRIRRGVTKIILQRCQECYYRQSFTPLLTALTHPNYKVRRAVIETIVQLSEQKQIPHDDIGPQLIQVANDSTDVGTRKRAIWALGAIRYSDEQVVDFLCRSLSQAQPPSIRWRAAWALGEIKADKAVGVLIRIAQDPSEDKDTKQAAIRAIGAIRPRGINSKLRTIIEKEKDEKLKQMARWSLKEIESKKKE